MSAQAIGLPGDGGRPPRTTSQEVFEPMAETMTQIKLKPLGDRVVVKPATREETTKSGIVLPDTAKEKPQRGTVVAVGEGRKDDDGDRIEMDVKVGDVVLFAKYAGTEFKLESEDLLILTEKDILAVIEE
jgi:chaperonin GroES